MKKTNLSKQFLKDAKNRFIVRFHFKVMAYYGKYNLSKKAVDIDLVKIEPLPIDEAMRLQAEDALLSTPPPHNFMDYTANQVQFMSGTGSTQNSLENAFANQMTLSGSSFGKSNSAQTSSLNVGASFLPPSNSIFSNYQQFSPVMGDNHIPGSEKQHSL